MPLLTTMAQAQQLLPGLLANINDISLLPNMDAAEATHLVPVIGFAYLQDLRSRLLSDELSEKETELLPHMRLVALAGGWLDELIASHVVITNEGVRTMNTHNMPKAVGWEYKELKAYLLDRQLSGTETLLQYLWANRADLAPWRESEPFARYQALLIRGGADFSALYTLHQPARTYHLLTSHIDDVQERYLEEQIGWDLLEYFLIKDAPDEAEKEPVRLLKKALAFYTIAAACVHKQVRIGDNGFTVVSADGGDRDGESAGQTAATSETIRRLEKQCEQEGKIYLGKAKTELTVLRKRITEATPFTTAFDAGPLQKRICPQQQTYGNERRKIFRF